MEVDMVSLLYISEPNSFRRCLVNLFWLLYLVWQQLSQGKWSLIFKFLYWISLVQVHFANISTVGGTVATRSEVDTTGSLAGEKSPVSKTSDWRWFVEYKRQNQWWKHVIVEIFQIPMDHRLIQPASRDQIVAIIRQRAERANLQRDLPAHLGQV